MRVLLRCDGGPGIGVGHVVRCLALAEEARSRGHDVALAGIVGGRFLEQAVAEAGIVVHEVAGCLGAAADLPSEHVWREQDVVHVDSYAVGADLHARLAAVPGGPMLSVMHDGDNGRRPAHLTIDPTVGSEWSPAPTGSSWSLRGGRWVPLRRFPERGRCAEPGEPLRVVIVMGGVDPLQCGPDALRSVVQAVCRLAATVPTPALGDRPSPVPGGDGREPSACNPPPGPRARVLAIATDDTRERLGELAAEAADHGVEVTVSEPIPTLYEHFRDADLVVSAAGTTVWELCSLGVAMALVRVVDNQRIGYDQVVGVQAAIGLGGPDEVGSEAAVDALTTLLADRAARHRLGERGRLLVDGRGGWRIVRAWEELLEGARPGESAGEPGPAGPAGSAGPAQPARLPRLTVREASLADARLLHAWRNDPVTRANSRSTQPVPWPDHQRWLAASLDREDRRLLVCADEDGPLGTVRWDRVAPGEWEVSLTVAPERRAAGLGSLLLAAGERHLVELVGGRVPGGVNAFLAVVAADNASSNRLFRGSGYLPDLPADEQGFARFVKLVR